MKVTEAAFEVSGIRNFVASIQDEALIKVGFVKKSECSKALFCTIAAFYTGKIGR